MSPIPEHSHNFTLSGAESNAEGCISLSLLASQIIAVASEHANILGVGYDNLLEHGIGWVLGRLSIEMADMPRMNRNYCISTWVEAYNRRFSNRNMAITAGDRTLGYVRSQWMAINFGSRSGAELSDFDAGTIPILDKPCPIEPPRRIATPSPDADTLLYTFRYTDIDFNRHVDTVRYIDLLMDCHSLDWHDRYMVGRIDLAFHHECLYGREATIRFTPGPALHTDYEILSDGHRAVSAAIDWTPRKK